MAKQNGQHQPPPSLGTQTRPPNNLPTIGEQTIEWIQKRLYVPEGRWIGTKVKLAKWQQKEIIRIYDNPRRTRRAILSFARKNGKTSLAAMLLLNHLCGPARVMNSQLYSDAQSREQAALIFHLAAKMARMSPGIADGLLIRDGSKSIECPDVGSFYRALSAEASTAYGLSPAFIIHDELGQVRGPRSELYEALETATGAQESPLSIVISTQAPSDADLLSILIDDALANNDPRVICSLYTVPKDDLLDPFAIETIRMANPALEDFLNPAEVIGMAEDARRMPAREAAFRNLVLNQRVEAVSPFVTPSVWKACAGEVASLDGLEVFGGLDLSEIADLTSLVLIGQVDTLWHAVPTFWMPGDNIFDKAQKDRAPYDLWAREGYLFAPPGPVVSYEYVARYLFNEVFKRYRVKQIAFDKWNFSQLKPWLLEAGFSEQIIKEKFIEFRQGWQSMSPAIRELETIILERKLRHGGHPVLTANMMNAVVVRDPAGNRKLDKKKSTGRIDGAVALTMAVGVAPMRKSVIDITTLIG
jgi:phage terminase large subunit-like protein